MRAASALPANAIAAPGGEGAGVSGAADGGDAFTSALAALMAVLGPAQPATTDPTAAAPSGVGAAAGTPAASQPGAWPETSALAPASAAPSLLTGTPSGALADALRALDDIVSDLEAATQGAGTGASASVGAGAASLGPSDDQLQALLSGLANPATGGAAASNPQPAEIGGPPSAPDAPVAASALDPQLIRFVARATAPQADAAATNDASSQASGAAPNVATAADPTAGPPPDAQTVTSATDAPADPTAPPANPIAAGLIVFNPAGQAPPQPLTSTRPTVAKTATLPATAIAAAKPAGLPDIRPAALAQLAAARDDAGADAPASNADAAASSDDSQDGDDPSSGGPPPALQLAGAPIPGAAPVAIPPAALAQAHGADIAAQLAAQIAARAGAVRSSFDFSLEPHGLGRVDVALKIDAQGGLSAVLSFDNPAVAAEARSRAGDLHQMLQQAGFDVSQSGLSFTANGGHGQGAAFQSAGQPSHAGASSSFAGAGPPELPPIAAIHAARAAPGGLDITI